MATAAGSVLVPVQLDQSPPPHVGARYDISGPDHIGASIVASLSPTKVVVLGYWSVPDQSSPQQLRDQFEDEARRSLQAVARPIEAEGFEVTTELGFTRDRDHLIDRVANSHGCSSVLSPGTVRSTPPESVLVLLRSDSEVDRIVETLGTLFAAGDVDIVLFHAVEGGDDRDAMASMLEDVAGRLADQGVDRNRIRSEQSDRGSRVDTIVAAVDDHDLVVLGESEPSVRERLFGPVQSAVTDRTDRPSLTVRADA